MLKAPFFLCISNGRGEEQGWEYDVAEMCDCSARIVLHVTILRKFLSLLLLL